MSAEVGKSGKANGRALVWFFLCPGCESILQTMTKPEPGSRGQCGACGSVVVFDETLRATLARLVDDDGCDA